MSKKILVTGGAGFIGSHTVVELIQAGYEPVIVDNLANSSEKVVDRIEQITGTRPAFVEADLLDAAALETIFSENDFDGYVMDTHTAVAMSAYDAYVAESEDEHPAIIVSTASPYKFPADVYEAITGERENDAFEATRKLN